MFFTDAPVPGTDATLAAAIEAVDWFRFSGGLLTGFLTALVAAVLAIWQHRVRFGERAEDRAREEKAAAEEREREVRRERRREESQAVRGLLDKIEKIDLRLDKQGPLTAATLDEIGARECAEHAELLARREIGAVREPLVVLAELLDDLRNRALDDATPTTSENVAACAFKQGRMVQPLGAALRSAWAALEQEWGTV